MASITNKIFKVISSKKKETVDKIQPSQNTEGNIYFVKDAQSIYYDLDGERNIISDVKVVATEKDMADMENSPIPNKFYYVEESNELYFRGSGKVEKWHNICPPEISFDFGSFE